MGFARCFFRPVGFCLPGFTRVGLCSVFVLYCPRGVGHERGLCLSPVPLSQSTRVGSWLWFLSGPSSARVGFSFRWVFLVLFHYALFLVGSVFLVLACIGSRWFCSRWFRPSFGSDRVRFYVRVRAVPCVVGHECGLVFLFVPVRPRCSCPVGSVALFRWRWFSVRVRTVLSARCG